MLSGNGSTKDREFSVSPVGSPAGISGLSLRGFDADATVVTVARGAGCLLRQSGASATADQSAAF